MEAKPPEKQPSGDELYWESFQRNIGIVTKAEQQKLKDSTVAVAGTGGVGGIYMAILARAGVGRFSIADPDTFDYANINRQYGATVQTVGRNKAEVMKEVIEAINPSAEVGITEGGLTRDNIEDFLQGCDIVLDCLDAYNIVELFKLHKVARLNGLYLLKGVPMGFGASLMVFSPVGMSFAEYFKVSDIEDIKDPVELLGDIGRIKTLYENYLNGFSPSKLYESYLEPDVFNPFTPEGEFTMRPLPSFCPSVYLSSVLVTTEVVLLLLKKREPVVVPECLEIDLFDRVFKISQPVSDTLDTHQKGTKS